MATFSAEQKKTFTTFEEYPWDADGVFQAGLTNIVKNLPPEQDVELSETTRNERQLIRAKHFFFSRFNHAFDLDDYIKYKELKNTLGSESESESEALFKRLEAYDFDHDDKYLVGLASVIEHWVRQQTEKGVIWDKSRMEDEFKKTKADYYARNIEPVDMDQYFAWLREKKEANQPACPFAHMWRNKGNGPATSLATPSNASFVVVSETRGAATLVLSSPGTNNIITVGRLDELKRAFGSTSENSTSLMLRAALSKNIMSSGLAFNETVGAAVAAAAAAASDQQQSILRSLDKLAESYYSFVAGVVLQQFKKPTLALVNGQVPLNAAYLFLWHGFIRVITEHAMLEFGLELSHAPIPPLLLLLLCRQRMAHKRPLPKGMELYLALAPPELVRMRGPELLRLGLADMFVPEVQLEETYNTLNKMSICPSPQTATALQLALASAHTYPGPDRLGVWEDEISRVFGDSETLVDIQTKLRAMDSRWSTTILSHWHSLPQTLLEVVFRAVKVCSNTTTPAKVFELEKSLNTRWRRSKNYTVWRTGGGECPEKWETEDVDPYFDDEVVYDIGDSAAAAVYEASNEAEDAAACPIMGQRSFTAGGSSFNVAAAAAGCPVTGKSAVVCPVTGQANGEVAQTCPVTGKTASATAMCPATGQKGLTCPITGQRA